MGEETCAQRRICGRKGGERLLQQSHSGRADLEAREEQETADSGHVPERRL